MTDRTRGDCLKCGQPLLPFQTRRGRCGRCYKREWRKGGPRVRRVVQDVPGVICPRCEFRPVYLRKAERRPSNACWQCTLAEWALAAYWRSKGMAIGSADARARMRLEPIRRPAA